VAAKRERVGSHDVTPFPTTAASRADTGRLQGADANGQPSSTFTLAGHGNEANIASVLTFNETRRIAMNVAKLQALLAS